jgi:putative restriction endonuclease
MKNTQKLWTKEELLLAINLYCKLPFGRLHKGNPEVINLAKLINRTPSSVAYKLVNFASMDPSLQARGIKGAQNVSKLDKSTWIDFFENIDNNAFESESLLVKLKDTTFEKILPEDFEKKEGKEKERLVKTRVNQFFFRQTILAAYNNKCCITGIDMPELLIASHIVPWKTDANNRLNPRNGICLNALHDKAFESGLLTITPD